MWGCTLGRSRLCHRTLAVPEGRGSLLPARAGYNPASYLLDVTTCTCETWALLVSRPGASRNDSDVTAAASMHTYKTWSCTFAPRNANVVTLH